LPSRDSEQPTVLYLPSASGVEQLSLRSGQTETTLAGPDTTGATVLVRAGSGFLAGGDSGTSFLH
jgi:hypothetical protein